MTDTAPSTNTTTEQQRYVMGIDLGTTYSCVGVWKEGKVEIVPNAQGHRTTPSWVLFTPDGQRLVGDAAQSQAAVYPRQTIFDVKRFMGKRFSDPSVATDCRHLSVSIIDKNDRPYFSIPLEDSVREFSPEEISAMILSTLKQQAEAYVGTTITEAVITVPAYFHDAQRQATKDAGVIAGLNVLRVVNEPTAASLAYGLDKERATDGKERHVLVFDCGGGTHDISLLSIADGIFEVKATAGNPHLGGEDIDQNLIQLCIQNISKEKNMTITNETHAVVWRRLHTACEELKRRLSAETTASFQLEDLLPDYDFSFTLSRARFEEYNQSFFRKVMEPVETVLQDAKVDVSQIDDIVLVGGTTRIPKIRQLLQDYFGKDPCDGIHPDECVAYGATIQAALLMGLQSKDMDDFLLLDVTPLSLGIETAGDVFTPLIPRGTTVPTQKTQIFSTYVDNQETATIKIMEGERPRASDNYTLGEFHLQGIPPQPRGVPQIQVSYDVSADGILKVTATLQQDSTDDSSAVISESLTVSPQDHRLSKTDIERMIQEAKEWEEKDQIWKETNEAKQAYHQFFFETKSRHLLRIEENEELKTLFTQEEEWLLSSQQESSDIDAKVYQDRIQSWMKTLEKWEQPPQTTESQETTTLPPSNDEIPLDKTVLGKTVDNECVRDAIPTES